MNGFDRDHDDVPWEAAPGTATSDWELAAAACELALLRRSTTAVPALPAELAGRIGRDAAAHLPRSIVRPSRPEAKAPQGLSAGRSAKSPRALPAGRSWPAAAGWWTAACLAGLLLWQANWQQWRWQQWMTAPLGGEAKAPSLAEMRGKLLAEDSEAVTIAWKKAGDDPTIVAGPADLESVGGLGDVVWSPTRQQGFMRFRGLAANDPAVFQYQLWIFDKERDEAYPVDGGVFDVPAEADGDVVVRIDPRLPVSRATAFAVTVEKSGGVVVSSRKRLPLLAAMP